MKKLLIAFLGTLLVAFAVISATPWSLPEADNFTYVTGNDSSAWAIENRSFDGCLYHIENNRVTAVYRRSYFGTQGQERLLLASSGSETPLVVESRGGTGGLYLLRPVKNGLETVCQITVGEGDTLLDYREEGDGTYLTCLTPAGGVQVFESFDPAGGKWAMLLAEDAPEGGSVAQACYRDGKLWILYDSGSVLTVTSSARTSSTEKSVFDKPSFGTLTVSFAQRVQSKLFLLLFVIICIIALYFSPIVAMLAGKHAEHLSTELFWAVLALYVSFACIVCLVALVFAPRESWTQLLPALCIALGLTAGGAGASAWVLYMHHAEEPLREIARQMSNIAEGQKTALQPLERRDELGSLSRSLQELSVSLSIRDYELSSTVQSYHRFVPRGIETLLERASIAEVLLGDSRTIEGGVGIFTICNRREVRALLGDDDFVSFVNRSASLMEETLQSHDGFLLSTGYDMAGDRVYFRNCEDGGVAAALDLLGLAAEGHDQMPRYFILLHKTSFLYGIAGSSDNLFPYLSSAELEFLAGYADRFYAAGSRIVVTESCYAAAKRNHELRHIGFVVSPDGATSLRLYEVLDAYSDLERNRRVGYDARFQEAIGLFYKSDFYLARNLFSDILRVCPTDGIARWYLFACEHFFQSGSDEAAFQLFGTDDQQH